MRTNRGKNEFCLSSFATLVLQGCCFSPWLLTQKQNKLHGFHDFGRHVDETRKQLLKKSWFGVKITATAQTSESAASPDFGPPSLCGAERVGQFAHLTFHIWWDICGDVSCHNFHHGGFVFWLFQKLFAKSGPWGPWSARSARLLGGTIWVQKSTSLLPGVLILWPLVASSFILSKKQTRPQSCYHFFKFSGGSTFVVPDSQRHFLTAVFFFAGAFVSQINTI